MELARATHLLTNESQNFLVDPVLFLSVWLPRLSQGQDHRRQSWSTQVTSNAHEAALANAVLLNM
jgi:hypothetical protein